MRTGCQTLNITLVGDKNIDTDIMTGKRRGEERRGEKRRGGDRRGKERRGEKGREEARRGEV